ncbi:MAG: hypothetical protein GX122_06375 [Candidatus Cloacimonetes bacterium]|nr:hypothetical protein [Candidatus Cloacimonadota bacterium]NLO12027.1 hypothetical protein [Candidatus Cloacimonadota bacterium]
MKVKFKYGIRTFSGTVDEMTYSSYKDGSVCIGRRWVMPKLTEQNSTLGKISKNLAAIWEEASDEYKQDFASYAHLYGMLKSNRRKAVNSGFSLFVKAMYAWGKTEDPALDLSTLTFEDIDTLGGKVENVANCVSYGFLPSVPGWEYMDGEI